jgi:hypothetical protein
MHLIGPSPGPLQTTISQRNNPPQVGPEARER